MPVSSSRLHLTDRSTQPSAVSAWHQQKRMGGSASLFPSRCCPPPVARSSVVRDCSVKPSIQVLTSWGERRTSARTAYPSRVLNHQNHGSDPDGAPWPRPNHVAPRSWCALMSRWNRPRCMGPRKPEAVRGLSCPSRCFRHERRTACAQGRACSRSGSTSPLNSRAYHSHRFSTATERENQTAEPAAGKKEGRYI